MNYPDKEGVWRCHPSDDDFFDFDVYPMPNGELCAWCDEVNRRDVDHTEYWDTDEFLGHIPVHFLKQDGEFIFLKERIHP